MRSTNHIFFILLLTMGLMNHSPTFAQNPKQFISSQELLKKSLTLAQLVHESGCRPTFLLSMWRGGAPIGLVVDEYFAHKQQEITTHLPLKVSSYKQDQQTPAGTRRVAPWRQDTITIFNLEYLAGMLTKDDRLLIVDDIVDSGRSLKTLLEAIKSLCAENTPHEIKTATIYYKPQFASIEPDFFVDETDTWIVFPHEVNGLTDDEITEFYGDEIAHILKRSSGRHDATLWVPVGAGVK